MVRILFALLLLQISCFSEEGVYKNLEKRVKYFNSANFEGIEFNRLYIRELEYIRKGDFTVLEASETIPTGLYTNYLYIYDNGKVLFLSVKILILRLIYIRRLLMEYYIGKKIKCLLIGL